MSRHDDRVTLHQMLDHIEEAMSFARNRQPKDLETDRVFFLALLKLVEIAGEAATRISDATQAKHPDFPWRELIGTRNRLVHGYDSVDFNILWNIVRNDFPTLADQVKAILGPAI